MSLTVGLQPGWARALRREIIGRNRRLAEKLGLAVVSSYGADEVVVFRAPGNLFAESYEAVVATPAWNKRLAKAHTGRRHLPKPECDKWRELDSCTSSDALLMTVFCHPRTLTEGGLHRLMAVDPDATPEFGVRVASPLTDGHRDRTEVDMRFGDVLVEAKLTETDFQSCRPELLEKRYTDFREVFEIPALPRIGNQYAGYQLVRNILAAHAAEARFCVIADARRPDLREQWYTVLRAIRRSEMRMRCQMLTWQEIAAAVPTNLRRWLEDKYGIFAPGCEPQVDAAEWYW